MGRVVFTRWREEQLIAKVPRILNEYGPLIGFQLQQEISKEQFDWPVDTYRKTGQYVPKGLRDIVDTGELLNSQKPPVITGTTLRIAWTAPYSLSVLQGNYVIGSVRPYIAPPRDWITPALKEKPLLPFFAERWKTLGR